LVANANSLLTVPTGPQSLQQLPAEWDLSKSDVLRAALQGFMPGHWDPTHVTKLSQGMTGGVKAPQEFSELKCVATAAEEVEPLLGCLHMQHIHTVLEPFTGTGGIANVLRRSKHVVITNDLNPKHRALMHQDALQPGFYQRVLKITPIDMVICSPWFAHLDIALPLAVLTATKMVAVHIPAHYWTNATLARYAYLKPFFTTERAHFVWGLPRGPMGMRCAWLCIFASSTLKQQLLRTGSYLPHTMTLPL